MKKAQEEDACNLVLIFEILEKNIIYVERNNLKFLEMNELLALKRHS